MSATINFDDLLEMIGGFGLYQKLLIIANVIFFTGNTWQYIITNFIVGKVDHWCKLPDIEGVNQTYLKELLIPKTTDELGNVEYEKCEMYDYNFTVLHNISDFSKRISADTANVSKVPCKDGWEYEQSVFLSSAISQFGLVCDKDWLYTMPATCYMVGILVGATLSGWMSDRFGRQRTTLIMTLVQIASIIGAAFSPFFWMFLVFRFVVGLASIGSFTPFWILVVESMPPVYRSHCAQYVAMGRILKCLLPLVAYFVRSHFQLQLVSAGMILPGLVCVFIMPESPRWLLSKRRFDDFEKIVRRIAKINKCEYPNDLEMKRISSDAIDPDRKDQQAAKQPTLFDLFRTPRLRIRTIITWFIWLSGVFAVYAMILNIGTLLPGAIHMNMLLVAGVSEGICFFTTWLALFKIGRRWTLVVFHILNGICSLIIIPLLLIKIPIIVTIIAMIGMVSIMTLARTIYLYQGEIYPTPARNIGLGSASGFGRLGGLISPHVPLLKKVWFGLPYICLAIFPIIAGILAYFLPETKDKRLPETLEQAEMFGTPMYDENIVTDDVDVANPLINGAPENKNKIV